VAEGSWPEDGFVPLGRDRYLLLKGLDGARQARYGTGSEEEDAALADALPLEVICLKATP